MWTNKKYGKKRFRGSYIRVEGERVFQLTREDGKRTITLESFQAAYALGWVYTYGKFA